MKKKSFFNKWVLVTNMFFAMSLLLTILVKYTSNSVFSFLSVLSLIVPFLIIANVAFMIYWLLVKRQVAVLSFLALLLGFIFFGTFYGISSKKDTGNIEGLKVMTYNVRSFNDLGQIKEPNIDSLIVEFIEKENPDIICMQEAYYALKLNGELKNYKYKFVDFVYGKTRERLIQAVFSKYPIINTQILDFPQSYNTAMHTDVLYKNDTIRLFNVHLQSFNIIPEVETIQKENSKKLLGQLKYAFAKQQEQAQLVRKSLDSTHYPTLMVGDLNNTQFSYVYYKLKANMSDSFLKKGSGFGRTYDLKGYPVRIDYIFSDENFEVLAHKNYDVKLSDHYPVMATIRLKANP